MVDMETQEAKIAVLGVEVQALKEVVSEMKTAVKELNVTMKEFADKTIQTQRNTDSIDVLFKHDESFQKQLNDHLREDREFHEEIKAHLIEENFKRKIFTAVWVFLSGIVSSVATMIIGSKIL